MADNNDGAKGERFSTKIDEGELAGWRWPLVGAPRLVFLHATGFCASAYKSMLGLVAPNFDIFAFDLRGHGRTRLAADPRSLRSWDIYARDIGAALDRLNETAPGDGWTLAGHSCGAVVATLAARGRQDIDALALIEPVAPPRATTFLARTPFWPAMARRSPLARGALARRPAWPDREAARASYQQKALFQRWASGVLDDYLDDGLTPAENGGVRLSCAPQWEAATFTAFAHDFWSAARRAPAPISVLGAAHPTTTLMGRAGERLEKLGARLEIAQGASHLLPFEAPAGAARFITERSG